MSSLLEPTQDFLYAGVLSVDKNKKAKDGRTFHVLDISDNVAKIKLYYWNPTCDFSPKSFIKFRAEHVSSNGSTFLSAKGSDVQEIKFSDLPESSSTRKLVFRYNVNIKELTERINDFTANKVVNSSFKNLIFYLSGEGFFGKIIDAPAGKSAHHSLEGGLLKHIEEMFDIYVNMSNSSVFSEIRHEFIILGIILHDYFKYREYENVGGSFQMTESAILLGHVYQGASFLQKAFDYVTKTTDSSFDELDKQKAIHVLLAHHGQLDWGSPVVPAIPEAIILHYIDQISAKLNMFSNSNNLEYNKFLGTSPIK